MMNKILYVENVVRLSLFIGYPYRNLIDRNV
jgi:hypothetical protein